MGKREEFTFDSRDSVTKIHAVSWIPDRKTPVCILQIVHGMAEYVDRYSDFAEFLNKRGILVVGDDHLGHGKTAAAGGTYGYFCEKDPATVIVRDEHRLKKMMQARYPGVPYLILGHSMGSFILRNYLCCYGTGIDGAVIMGTGMQSRGILLFSRLLGGILQVFQGGNHKSELMNFAAFGAYNKRIKKPRTRMDWLSGNEGNVNTYVDDPLCGFTFTLNGFATLSELLRRLHDPDLVDRMPIELPLLLVAGEEDPVGGYGKAVRELYESYRAMGMERVQLTLYPAARHEILNETDREDIYQDIYRWILSVVG